MTRVATGRAAKPPLTDVRQSTFSRPPSPTTNAEEGAGCIHAYVVKLFAREDGEAVDQTLIADSLFRAAFSILDKLPVEARHTIARRVHEGSYSRLTAGDDGKDGSSQVDGLGSVPAPSHSRPFKSTAPRPPRVGH